jgi:hypothetical protein
LVKPIDTEKGKIKEFVDKLELEEGDTIELIYAVAQLIACSLP